MRSCVRALTAVLLVAATIPALAAQSSQPQRLYNDALERERSLRQELESASTTTTILPRVRALVGAYEDMSKLFPASGYGDNALWQGARLAADAFWQFGDALDRSLALRLFNALTMRFPTSSLVRQVAEQTKRLNEAKAAPAAAQDEDNSAAKSVPTEIRLPSTSIGPAPSTAPRPGKAETTKTSAALRTEKADNTTRTKTDIAPAVRVKADTTKPDTHLKSDTATPARPSSSGVAALNAIRRDVLPEALRITLELGREVTFSNERIDGPPRVFIDLQNTRAVEALKDAVIPFADDVVKQVRVGRQLDQRTRVVMDLRDAGRYSVYTLYDPYRIIIDFERPAVSQDAVVARNNTKTPAPTRPAASSPRNTGTSQRDASVAAAVATKAAVLTTSAPTSDSAIAPTLVSTIAPTDDSTIAPTTDSAIAPANGALTLPAPAPPSTNRNGNFSLSRQLGLGIAKIVIDAGHGGHDPGAQARGLTEADLVLDVALRLEKLMLKTGIFEVVLTRRTNTYVSLEERTAIANRVGADLFLSIHSNASSNATARGIETYFLNFAPNPEAEAVAARENAGESRTMRNLPGIVRAIALNNKIDESRDFASMVQTSMYSQMRKSNTELRNLGVKQAPFMVLVGATMPSVLAEISFITNSKDAALLKTDKYRQQIAEALLNGVLRYQQSLKRAPAIATK